MKPYQNQNYISLKGSLILIAGSILAGIAVGALAFVISNFFYLLFVFAFFVGCAGALLYGKLVKLSKVHHTLITTALGVGMGLWIALGYYGIPYLVDRRDYVQSVQEEYQVDARVAEESLNYVLRERTGSGGFWGYMKLRAAEGDELTNYLIVNSLPIFEFTFTLKSTGAWIYWSVETLLFALLSVLFGRDAGKQAFNRDANDWYDPYQKQIGSAPISESRELLSLIERNDLEGLCGLIQPEEAIPHPTLELYEQHTKNLNCGYLFTLKQTNSDHKPKIKRRVLGQWEMGFEDYQRFSELVKQKFEEIANSAA